MERSGVRRFARVCPVKTSFRLIRQLRARRLRSISVVVDLYLLTVLYAAH
eukprot:SAG31_NODE_27403_length_426_cov_1.302752_2_plen_49_part_01